MSKDAEGPEDPRVRFAAERTLLAWIRTGLAMMGFGFVVARFGLFLREVTPHDRPPPPATGFSITVGTVLVLLGVAVNLIAALEHVRLLRRLDGRLPYQPPGWSLGVITAVVLAVVGVATTVYLVAQAR